MTEHPWLEEPPEPVTSRRRWLLLVLAALPWLAVIALLVVPVVTQPGPDRALAPAGSPDEPAATSATTDARPPGTTGAEHADHSDQDAHTGSVDDDAADPIDEAPAAGRDDDPVGSDDAAIGAVATMVVRAWLTGVGAPVTGIEVTPRTTGGYAEHLTTEHVHQEGELALVTVIGVLIDTADEPDPPRLVRVVVPLADGPSGIRLVTDPYELPIDELARSAPVTEPVDGPLSVEAAAALSDAGFADDALQELARTAAGPLVARVGDQDDSELIWLHRDRDGELVVFGLDETRMRP